MEKLEKICDKTSKVLKNTQSCYWYTISRVQRDDELMRGDGFAGTKNYKSQGCYDCAGVDSNKKCYMNLIK